MKKLLKKIMVTGVALASLFAFTGCPGAAQEAPEEPVVDQRTEFEKKWPDLPRSYVEFDTGSEIYIYKDATYKIEYTENGKTYKEMGSLGYVDSYGEDYAEFYLFFKKTVIENKDGTVEETDSARFGKLWITAERDIDSGCYFIVIENEENGISTKYEFI